MPEQVPILEVTSEMRGNTEQLGSKPKFWFRYQDEEWLFKEARENTGEDWAEKAGSEIAALLGLPTHHAELATHNGKRGCAVRSFLLDDDQTLIHGNELLEGLISGYDKEKQRGQSHHTLDNIIDALLLFVEPEHRVEAFGQMIGYLLFDALIGNTDRHHQNWGVVSDFYFWSKENPKMVMHLAPTFDHASSLGRELTDETRERYLREGAKAIERYIRKGRGGIFENPESRRGPSPIALAEKISREHPAFFKFWRARIAALDEGELESIFQRLPGERAGPAAKRFALALLTQSRDLLLSLPTLPTLPTP